MTIQGLFRRFRITCALLSAVAIVSAPLQAENWPQWRGPRGNSVSAEENLPAEWSREKNVAWRLELPGAGQSTPAVWDDRIFLTSVDSKTEELLILCISTGGKLLWQQSMGRGDEWVRVDEGNRAAPSPSTDGKHVWVMMANGEIGCFTVEGKKVWQFNLQRRYGRFDIQFGMTSTPAYHDGRLYQHLIHGSRRTPASGEASVLALDALTGEEAWKHVRKSDAYDENKHAYTSPIIYDEGEPHHPPLMISHGADYVIAYRLSDGKEIWRCGGLNPQNDPGRRYHPTLRFVASPTYAEGIVVVPTAKRGPVIAIRPDAVGFEGDITNVSAARLWSIPRGTPDVPCPLIYNGLVYLNGEWGNLTCLDSKTGEEVYLARTERQKHRVSPVYADGKIFLISRDGKVTVVKAGREFEILAKNDFEEEIAASPAISNGTIYFRTWDALWAIRK